MVLMLLAVWLLLCGLAVATWVWVERRPAKKTEFIAPRSNPNRASQVTAKHT
jgi:uncharacterized iron-regulated membrane protein